MLGMIGCGQTWGRQVAVGCEVGVQLDHGAARGHGVSAVDLDLVVALGSGNGRGNGKQNQGDEADLQRALLDGEVGVRLVMRG